MTPLTLNWVGGEHEFLLRIGELRALQEKTDAGPLELMHRIVEGRWRVDDLFETLRLGLIGGGMLGRDAQKLVSEMFERHPLTRFALPAQAVLISALSGPVEGEPDQGKTQGVETEADGTGQAGMAAAQ